MDLQRVRKDIQEASTHFSYLEAVPDGAGGLYAKAVLQTAMQMYVLTIGFTDYPLKMPTIAVTKPTISHSKHRYTNGHICYMHPNFWNPGKHDLKYVLSQVAVWLSKHEVYIRTERWPGPELKH